MEDQEAKSVIEALLFMAGEPVTLDRVRKIVEIDKYNTDRLLRELISYYSLRNTGLFIVEVAEGFQMVTNPACSPWVKKLLSTSVPKKLTQSSLETMAIIAYKQPIIKAEIEAIRGVNSDGVVKTLLEKRLIKILGRKEVPGRPLLYGTTGEFLQYFGLKNLSELPTLKEFAEVDIPEPTENSTGESGEPVPGGEEKNEYSEAEVPGNEEDPVQSGDRMQSGSGQGDGEVHHEDKPDAVVDSSSEEQKTDSDVYVGEEAESKEGLN